MSQNIAVEFKNISKSFGETEVLKNISLSVKEGEFLVLVGPSGCGKSTLLRTLAGLEAPTAGEVFIAGRNVTSLEPRARNLSMVFQSYALYPHLSVRDNLAFGLSLQGTKKSEIEDRVKDVAGLLRIEALLDRRPRALSGGQRQRVALGRALVRRTPLVLFDEPLSNLDAALRGQMRFEIKKMHQTLGSTIIYVTHDQVEATTLGDRIAVLNKGEIAQIGPASEIYEKPASRFVAGFIGTPEMNFLPGTLFGRTEATVGIRPEDLTLKEGAGAGILSGKFELEEYLGSQALIHVEVSGQSVRVLSPHLLNLQPGTPVFLAPREGKTHVFDDRTGQRIEG